MGRRTVQFNFPALPTELTQPLRAEEKEERIFFQNAKMTRHFNGNCKVLKYRIIWLEKYKCLSHL